MRQSRLLRIRNQGLLHAKIISGFFFVCILVFFVHGRISALPGNIVFENIDYSHGLSQNTVHSIMKDSKGFMWFGTQDGLNRYDGYNFEIFRHKPFDEKSIGNSSINEIVECQSRCLWIATLSDGLYRFDLNNNSFKNYHHSEDNASLISSTDISALLADSVSVWIGTKRNGPFRFFPDSGKIEQYGHDTTGRYGIADYSVNDIYKDSKGNIWIGTNDGLDKLSPGSKEFTHYHIKPDGQESNVYNVIVEIFEDSKDTIWIASWYGLQQFDPVTGEFKHFADIMGIKCMLEDNTGNLWIGTQDNGLLAFDTETGSFSHYKHDKYDVSSISSNGILSLFKDDFGTLWIGTKGGGINKIKQNSYVFSHYGELHGSLSLNTSVVYSIYEDADGIIWAGTSGGGLNKIDKEKNSIIYYTHDPHDKTSLSNNTVVSLFEDSRGLFWVCTAGGGIQVFDRRSGEFSFYNLKQSKQNKLIVSSMYVWSIIEDKDGIYWMGTVHGLTKFDIVTETLEVFRNEPDNPLSISSDNSFCVLETSDGDLWIGTSGGLNNYDRTTGIFKRFNHDPKNPGSISSNMAWSIYEDNGGTLWIGTWGGGLNKYDPVTESFVCYSTEDGLPNNVVYTILEDDDGNLWMSTNEGISCFNPRTESFRNYLSEDGILGKEFNMNASYKNKHGEMLFGGIKGVTVFHPGNLTQNTIKPPVYITRFSSNQTNITPIVNSTPEVILERDSNNFSFEFVSLDYTSPKKNKYMFMLEGFDNDWINSGTRRYARYTGLKPGEYLLRVRGTNSDGLWSDDEAEIGITVKPYFWETLWFSCIIAVSVVVLTAGAYKLRTNYLIQLGERQKMYSDYLSDALEKERTSISREIHDEFGQVMTALKINMSLVKGKLLGNQDYIKEKIQYMSELIDMTNINIQNFIENLRPSRLDELGLLVAMEWYVDEFNKRTGILTIFNKNIDEIDLGPNINTALFRILQESLTNIARHAQATKANVQFMRKNNRMELTISDDGIGIEKTKLNKDQSFGLMGIKERARNVGGNVTIQTKKGKGTFITISLVITENIHGKKDQNHTGG